MVLFDRLSLAQRSLIPSFAGFFFYGSWAFLMNYMYGTKVALKAGFVQGSYSFLVTLVMTLMLEGLHKTLGGIFNNRNLINWLTILICCSIVFSGSWLVNYLAGTPEIFRTVILGYTIGGIYSISYVYGLAQKRQFSS